MCGGVLRALLCVALLSAGLLMSSPAASGGGSALDFDREYYVPGDVAIGRTLFTARIKGNPGIEDGPWYAYLVPTRQWIDPPRIPASAIPLGPLTIVDRVDDVNALARIRFVMPDVEPGAYAVNVCNDPCRDAYVGDLIGGWFSVADSHEDAQLLMARERQIERLRSMRYRLRREARQAERVFEQRVSSLETENAELGRRLSATQADLARLGGDRGPSPVAMAGWGIAALLLVTLAIVIKHRQKPLLLAPYPTERAASARDLEEVLK